MVFDQLTPVQLDKIGKYKYQAEGTSLIEAPFQVFWCWLADKVPGWWAPNAITTAGLLVNTVAMLLLIAASPDARQEPGSWYLYLCCVAYFIYQTLDCLDGKQARRTNSSTPLGRLFDHGGDAFTIVLVVIGVSIALQLGDRPWFMFVGCLLTFSVEYVSLWKTYCHGIESYGGLNWTEGEVGVMCMYIVSAIFGCSAWSVKIPLMGAVDLRLSELVLLVYLVNFALSIYSVVQTLADRLLHADKKSSDYSDMQPLVPFVILIGLATLLIRTSTRFILERHPVLFVASVGLSSAKLSTRLLVADMSRGSGEMFDRTLLLPAALLLNHYFSIYHDQYLLLWLYFVLAAIDLSWYMYRIMSQVATHLKLSYFSITSTPAASRR